MTFQLLWIQNEIDYLYIADKIPKYDDPWQSSNQHHIIIMAMMMMMMEVGAKPATNSDETAATDEELNNCGNISFTLDKKTATF